ncbi:rod shape-determining protein [bacterium]|nr:rod shape-determining protein [bacterium]
MFWRRKQKNLALALDIGTEFVKTLIFEVKEGKAEIIGAGRKRQRLGDMQGGAVRDIKGVIQTAELAIEEAEKEAQSQAPKAILGIAGELVKGATTIVHYTRLNPEKEITFKELAKIIRRVQEEAFSQAREILAEETGHSSVEVKLVNSAIVEVKIDGYRVNNPIGFKGKEVVVGVFNAFAPLVHLGALQTIADELGLDLLSIAVEPYAVARAFIEEGDYSAIFIDIGGGTTDVAVVRKGGIEGTKMFALGGRAFTNRIAQELNLSFSEAEKIKLKYSAGNVVPEIKKKVQKGFRRDVSVWAEGLNLSLAEFVDEDLLPSRIFLCGGGSLLPEIKKQLQKSDWRKGLPFARSPKVEFLSLKGISSVIDRTGRLSAPEDITPVALASLSLELVGEESILDEVLSQAVRALRT